MIGHGLYYDCINIYGTRLGSIFESPAVQELLRQINLDRESISLLKIQVMHLLRTTTPAQRMGSLLLTRPVVAGPRKLRSCAEHVDAILTTEEGRFLVTHGRG